MREEEGGKETRGEGGERSCKQRLDSQGATITRIKTLVPQVDTVLTEGPQLVDRTRSVFASATNGSHRVW